MESPFGRYLSNALRHKGWTQGAFAEKVGYSRPGIQQILAGKNKFPLKHMDKWLAVLGEAVNPGTFRELALLTRAPAEVQALVERQRGEVERLKRRKRRKRKR